MPLTLYVARASGSSSQILRVLRHMNDGKTVEVEVVGRTDGKPTRQGTRFMKKSSMSQNYDPTPYLPKKDLLKRYSARFFCELPDELSKQISGAMVVIRTGEDATTYRPAFIVNAPARTPAATPNPEPVTDNAVPAWARAMQQQNEQIYNRLESVEAELGRRLNSVAIALEALSLREKLEQQLQLPDPRMTNDVNPGYGATQLDSTNG